MGLANLARTLRDLSTPDTFKTTRPLRPDERRADYELRRGAAAAATALREAEDRASRVLEDHNRELQADREAADAVPIPRWRALVVVTS